MDYPQLVYPQLDYPQLDLGTIVRTRFDEFSENFKTASDPPLPQPSFGKLCCAFLGGNKIFNEIHPDWHDLLPPFSQKFIVFPPSKLPKNLQHFFLVVQVGVVQLITQSNWGSPIGGSPIWVSPNGGGPATLTPFGLTPNDPNTLPMGILRDYMSYWTTLGPFQRPTGAPL